MQTLPSIGAQVRCRPNAAVGDCQGIITKVYPSFDPESLQQEPFDPATWHVCVKVSTLPERWPYSGDQFAPAIEDVELL